MAADAHLLGAIAVYEREVATQIEGKKSHAYANAVDLLACICTLGAAANESERSVTSSPTCRSPTGPRPT